MPKEKKGFFEHSYFQVIGAIGIILLALVLLWRGNVTNNQAMPALVAQVYFDGEYRIDTGLVKCDYLSFLETGKPEFHGEYMTQYSWAEATCGMLQFKNNL